MFLFSLSSDSLQLRVCSINKWKWQKKNNENQALRCIEGIRIPNWCVELFWDQENSFWARRRSKKY